MTGRSYRTSQGTAPRRRAPEGGRGKLVLEGFRVGDELVALIAEGGRDVLVDVVEQFLRGGQRHREAVWPNDCD